MTMLLHSATAQTSTTTSQRPPKTPMKQPHSGATPSPASLRRVSRCLFGRPDAKEQRAWLRDRLDDCLDRQKSRELWGFDFVTETPLDTPPSSSQCDWEWSRVPANSLASPYQPAVYVNSPTLLLKPSTTAGSSTSWSTSSVSSTASSLNSSGSASTPSPTITGYFASRKRAHDHHSRGGKKASSKAVGGDTPCRRRALAAAAASGAGCSGAPGAAPPKIARLKLAKCMREEL